jgi:hypothetical protein
MEKFEYKGFKYVPWDDYEDDNIKRFHDVVAPDGSNLHIDLSPYERLNERNFQKWIDLGMPDRGTSCGPLSNEDIERMWLENSKRFIKTIENQEVIDAVDNINRGITDPGTLKKILELNNMGLVWYNDAYSMWRIELGKNTFVQRGVK